MTTTPVKELVETYGAVEGSVGVRQGSAKLLLLVPADHALLSSIGQSRGSDPDGHEHYVLGTVIHREKSMKGLGYVMSDQDHSYDGSPALLVDYPGQGGKGYTQRLIKTRAADGTDGAIPAIVTEVPTDDLSAMEIRIVGQAAPAKTSEEGSEEEEEDDNADDDTSEPSELLALLTPKDAAKSAEKLPAVAAGASIQDALGAPLNSGDIVKWSDAILATFIRPGVTVGEIAYHYIAVEGAELCVASSSLVKQ